MTMFFSSLALDIAVPAVILLGLLVIERASTQFKYGANFEGRTA
jgi:hypothetical protein